MTLSWRVIGDLSSGSATAVPANPATLALASDPQAGPRATRLAQGVVDTVGHAARLADAPSPRFDQLTFASTWHDFAAVIHGTNTGHWPGVYEKDAIKGVQELSHMATSPIGGTSAVLQHVRGGTLDALEAVTLLTSLRHEADHATAPLPPGPNGRRLNTLSQGSIAQDAFDLNEARAELIARNADEVSQLAERSGLPFDLQAFEAYWAEPHYYDPVVARWSAALRAAGIDPSSLAANALLHADPVLAPPRAQKERLARLVLEYEGKPQSDIQLRRANTYVNRLLYGHDVSFDDVLPMLDR